MKMFLFLSYKIKSANISMKFSYDFEFKSFLNVI